MIYIATREIYVDIYFAYQYVLDIFVVTRKDEEMSEIFGRLMESLFEVLAAVTGLEASTKAARNQHDSNHAKNDC